MIQPEQWERLVLELSKAGNIGAACEAAHIARSSFYRRRDEDPQFAAESREAIEDAMDRLESAAWTRAVEGVERITPSGMTREYSDSLLMFLLKAHRPAKYRTTIRQEHTGQDGQPLAPAVVILPALVSDQSE